MTDARRVFMPLVILAALLFMGSNASSEAHEPPLSEDSLIQAEHEQGLHNISKKPRLQPTESQPLIGNYSLKRAGRVCLRAEFGVVYMVTEDQKTLFYNLDPKSTVQLGNCSEKKAVFELDFDGGSLQFTFTKDGSVTYVRTLRAQLELEPPCKGCQGKRYFGILDKKTFFRATKGLSFKCKTAKTLKLTENLKIKIVSMQIQAFDLPNGAFGKVFECWADYNKRIVPIVVGAVVVGIILIAILVFVLSREHREYEQL